MHKKKIIIGGLTASGKSDLAIKIAEKIGAEIINADPFQMFAGLEVLTASPNFEQKNRVLHRLYNFLPVEEEINIFDYVKYIDAELMPEKPQILVGGNGFYLQALTEGLQNTPQVDFALRKKLNKKSLAELQSLLAEKDPLAFAKIDSKNKRRLSRALEIFLQTGRSILTFQKKNTSHNLLNSDNGKVFTFFLDIDRDVLQKKIASRTENMLAGGAIQEVENILSNKNLSPNIGRIIGFREISSLLNNEISLDECREKITIVTRRLAKKQRTWFKNKTSFCELSSAELIAKISS